ncbi:ABC-type transport system substrate-binding protein [Rhizobium binae]|uniref:ABC-type transport system substrate-binding protein n=1 Tax=Rhizobium binae TaxID=1138190 RepID=A0ABV2MJJ5_9HYPH
MAIFHVQPKYWGGKPAMARLIAGDVDVGQYVASGDLNALASNKDMAIDNIPSLGFYYIALRQKDPDLQKRRPARPSSMPSTAAFVIG